MAMAGKLKVLPAGEERAGEFAAIVEEAAAWLRQNGQAMWSPEQTRLQRLLNQYAINEMYIGYVDEEPAAAMALQEADPWMWPDEAPNGNALYLHKLSVRRTRAKSGCSAAMIGWAKEEASRRGKMYLRLDCAADRPKLCAFYERYGFRKVRERLIRDIYLTALYEWRAETST